MSLIARLRRRRELQWQMRKANPRGLTAECYQRELMMQKAALREVEIAKALPPQPTPEMLYWRQHAPASWMPSPPMTRGEQAAAMTDEARRRANGWR